MDTHADDQSEQMSEDQAEAPSAMLAPSEMNGTSGMGVGHAQKNTSLPRLKRAVTPSTLKWPETPTEHEARIRDQRAVLESLRAKTPEEADEQRETLEFLVSALNEGRAPYPKVFAARDDE